MNQSRFARLYPSRFAFQSRPSEQYQHPRPTTSFRNRIINLIRPRSARENQAHNSRTGSSPVVEDTCPPYAPPTVQVDSRPYGRTPHPFHRNSHHNNVPGIVITESGGEPSSHDFPPDILHAPRLPQVSLPWTVPNAWTDFKRLELTCHINMDDCLLILQYCTLLTELKLNLVERNSLTVVRSRVEVRNLRSLTICSSCGNGPLFRSLKLPQLTSVHLSWTLLDKPPTDIGLRSLIARSRCPLETLCLINVFLMERELVGCLGVVTPSLINLVVRNDHSHPGMSKRRLSEMVIRFLTKTDQSSEHCCPKLTRLELSPCVSNDGFLAQMVASRAPVHDLAFSYSFLDPSLHTNDIQYLTTLGNSALHVIHQLQFEP